MVIQQGDVVWVELPSSRGSVPAGRRPAVVLQHDRFNRSKLQTTVVVAITSNLKYASMPGNVRLHKGEAGLTKPSVVNVTQIASIDINHVTEIAGHLSRERILEVWRGVRLVLEPAVVGA